MRDSADGGAKHRADEQARSEDSAGVARCVGDRGGDDLEHGENEHDSENHIAVENSLDLIVSDAQHLWNEETKNADREPASDGLKPERRIREPQKALAQRHQQLDECDGSESAEYSEHRVNPELPGADEM